MSQPMLTLNGLTKRYGERTAVDNLDLTIDMGEIFGLLGPNGAGKSTTVHMAVGLVRPDAGLVGVGPENARPTDPGTRRAIGVAPQALSLYDALTADENLRFFGSLQGLRRESLDQRAAWSLKFAGLTDRARDRVVTFSGGMKRRLNMAVALVHDPQIVMLDEPTVGVDPQSRIAIFESIRSLRQAGKTIVYTTHYMEEAQRLCDRVGIIDHGRLLAMDTVPALIEAHGGDSVVTAETAEGAFREQTRDPVEVLRRLQSAGGLTAFHVQPPDLESVFLQLTGRTLRD